MLGPDWSASRLRSGSVAGSDEWVDLSGSDRDFEWVDLSGAELDGPSRERQTKRAVQRGRSGPSGPGRGGGSKGARRKEPTLRGRSDGAMRVEPRGRAGWNKPDGPSRVCPRRVS